MTTNPITSITVNGTPLDLDTVTWEMDVTHGRQDISAAPQSALCQFKLRLAPTAAIPVAVADVIVVEAHSLPRFTGTVTGLMLEHEDTPTGIPGKVIVQVGAVGNLVLLDTFTDGATGFVEETFEDRATGILTTTGLSYSISNDDATVLLAEDPGNIRTVRDLLGSLCETVGATMADLPDGTILLETYTNRAINYSGGTWVDATGTWAANTQPWRASRTTLELPAGSVMWAPQWLTRVDTVVNDVTVSYGALDPQDLATDSDAASITTYGTRSAYIQTTMKNVADADARAAAVLTAQGTARWNIPAVTVLVDTLDTTTRDAVLAIESGDRVLLNGLPTGSPDTPFLGVIEGWTESIRPEGHRLTLHLSDPRYSFAMLEWDGVPGALTWATANATATWSDVVLATDI